MQHSECLVCFRVEDGQACKSKLDEKSERRLPGEIDARVGPYILPTAERGSAPPCVAAIQAGQQEQDGRVMVDRD